MSEGRGASPAEPGPAPQLVLLVDDEPDIALSLKEYLESALPGVAVHTALTGRDGLAALRERAIDLIITDYKMPGMNGLEFLRLAHQEAPGVPRMLITAFPDLEIAVRAINEEEIEKFFTKPLDPTQVVDAVRGVLFDRRTKALANASFSQSLEMLRSRGAGEAGEPGAR